MTYVHRDIPNDGPTWEEKVQRIPHLVLTLLERHPQDSLINGVGPITLNSRGTQHTGRPA